MKKIINYIKATIKKRRLLHRIFKEVEIAVQLGDVKKAKNLLIRYHRVETTT